MDGIDSRRWLHRLRDHDPPQEFVLRATRDALLLLGLLEFRRRLAVACSLMPSQSL